MWILLLLSSLSFAYAEELLVFAASSLTDAMGEVGRQFERVHNVNVRFNFDASSRLAMQIEKGAPADLFFSADKSWSDYLEKKQILKKEGSQVVLSNKLVLITHKKNQYQINDLASLPQIPFRTIVLAHENVPAGKYAYEVLKKLNLYDGLKTKIVNGDNVRHVLAWVTKNEADLGIVFVTDALAEPSVKVLLNVPEKLHSSIVYPLSIIKKNSWSTLFFNFCHGPEARKVFEKAGFVWIAQ